MKKLQIMLQHNTTLAFATKMAKALNNSTVKLQCSIKKLQNKDMIKRSKLLNH